MHKTFILVAALYLNFVLSMLGVPQALALLVQRLLFAGLGVELTHVLELKA
mgnify:CR=1 FL=1